MKVVRPKRFLVNFSFFIYQKLSIFSLFNYFLLYPLNPDCVNPVNPLRSFWYGIFRLAQEAFLRPCR